MGGKRHRSRVGGRLPDEQSVTQVLDGLNWEPHLRGCQYWADCARCGHTYRTHVQEARKVGLVAKDPCPQCGTHVIRKARPDIGGEGHGTR